MGFDDGHLSVPEYGADIFIPAVLCTLAQALTFFEYQTHEFAVDVLHHVDALCAAAVMASVHARAYPSAVCGTV